MESGSWRVGDFCPTQRITVRRGVMWPDSGLFGGRFGGGLGWRVDDYMGVEQHGMSGVIPRFQGSQGQWVDVIRWRGT